MSLNIYCYFYVYGSVHRWSILIIVQRDTTQSSLFIILQVHSTCFGCHPHPSSGVHKTVTTASGTGYIFVQLPPSNVAKLYPTSAVHKTVTTASGNGHIFVQLPLSNVAKLDLAALDIGSCTKIWPVPEAVVTVLCTPDVGCGWHPKHVEWTCRIVNRLLCVASS
jgi:hypothetical protein